MKSRLMWDMVWFFRATGIGQKNIFVKENKLSPETLKMCKHLDDCGFQVNDE